MHKIMAMAMVALAVAMAGVPCHAGKKAPRVYVNPGHGGHDSDDRNLAVLWYAPGDTAGYWESNSNLTKGNSLVGILRQKGYEVMTSRTANTTSDDLDLFEVAMLANVNGADLFLAIHSNATGTANRVNFPLALYRGWTDEPANVGSAQFADMLTARLMANKATVWSHKASKSGDWTFYPRWGYKMGLGVLRFNAVPGMLSEGEFHDYLPETLRLLNPSYCWLEAWNMSLVIDDYFKRTKKASKDCVIAGNVRDAVALREDSVKLYGDDARRPVNGATVQLLESKGKRIVAQTRTDHKQNGIYVFKGVKPGKYLVRVVASGYATSETAVKVKRNDVAYCNFNLKEK